MEAVELGLHEALLQDGRKWIEGLYQREGLEVPEDAGRPGEKCHAGRTKEVRPLFGPIGLRRNYDYDPRTGSGRCPLDKALGLVESFSPTVVRLGCRVAAKEGYESASQDLRVQAERTIEGRQIQRWVNRVAPHIAAQLEESPVMEGSRVEVLDVEVDGTGVPMVAEELEGRPGKQEDGTSKTREVKPEPSLPRAKPIRSASPCGTTTPRPTSQFRVLRRLWHSRAPGSLETRRGAGAQSVGIGAGAAWIGE